MTKGVFIERLAIGKDVPQEGITSLRRETLLHLLSGKHSFFVTDRRNTAWPVAAIKAYVAPNLSCMTVSCDVFDALRLSEIEVTLRKDFSRGVYQGRVTSRVIPEFRFEKDFKLASDNAFRFSVFLPQSSFPIIDRLRISMGFGETFADGKVVDFDRTRIRQE